MKGAPLRILLVDDETMAVERLQILLAKIPGVAIAGTASDGASALRLLDDIEADLILLDISMPGLDGVGVAKALKERDRAPLVIFVTAYDHHAVQAFELAATDYLLKPVSASRLAEAIDRARTALSRRDDGPADERWLTEFWVPHRSDMIRLASEDIDRIEAERDYMRLHVGDRSYLLHDTAKNLEDKLDPDNFLRIHRSQIVRIDAVARLHHEGLGVWDVIMNDGSSHRIGRTYLPHVKRRLKTH
ncbi:MAG: LytTR family DNA-binding domain-containing protein [Pacificimonas sp.]